MDMPNRLPAEVFLRKLVQNLRPIDTVSIVVYGSVVGVMLQPTSGDNKKRYMMPLRNLHQVGSLLVKPVFYRHINWRRISLLKAATTG
jgi:Ca-activated chloride channel family protein